MRLTFAILLICLSGCVTSRTPEQEATRRFDNCMDSTVASVGPFSFATQDQRLKAAAVCKDVMRQ